MKLTEFQRHEVLRELIPNLPYNQLAARVLAPVNAAEASGPGARLAAAWRVLAELPSRWRRATEREMAIAELKRLDARLLADVGLEHGDIEHVVDALQAASSGPNASHVAAQFVDRR